MQAGLFTGRQSADIEIKLSDEHCIRIEYAADVKFDLTKKRQK